MKIEVTKKNGVKKHGVPRKIYLDRFATYKINHPRAEYNPKLTTQFQKVSNILDIQLIFANTPQAKWRVEKRNKTLSDRWTKEFRLANIDNVKYANNYIKNRLIPKFNKKFWKKPKNQIDMHRELDKYEKENIYRIFAKRYTRTIANDYTISYKNQLYQLYNESVHIYPKLKVTIEEQLDWHINITYNNKILRNDKIEERPPKYTDEELRKMKE